MGKPLDSYILRSYSLKSWKIRMLSEIQWWRSDLWSFRGELKNPSDFIRAICVLFQNKNLVSILLELEIQMGLARDKHHWSINFVLLWQLVWQDGLRKQLWLTKTPVLFKKILWNISPESAYQSCGPEIATFYLKLVAKLDNAYENFLDICFEHILE